MNHFGQTRTHIARNHAFIAPDGHVWSNLPGWTNSQAAIFISPHMGAKFTMSQVKMGAKATGAMPLPGHQRFLFLIKGHLWFNDGQKEHRLDPGWFAYCPPDQPHTFRTTKECEFILFEKPYVPLAGVEPPHDFIFAYETDRPSTPFMGDKDAQLRLLLPDTLPFDMAINLFTFKAGTTLPYVETHIMEHGMMMLDGGGIYRLEDNWYPIQAGDVLWMGPYCPQWFAALGKPESTYLYYKNINRDAFIL